MFFKDITPEWHEEMHLVSNLSTFTILTFSPRLDEEQANKLSSLSHEIIRQFSTLKNRHYKILHDRATEKIRKAKENKKKKQEAKVRAALKKGEKIEVSDSEATKKEKLPELKTYKLTSKWHHLTHYGELTKQFGPLYNYSALRWERKHQFPKKVARMMKCFINPSFTIATRHQYLRAVSERKNGFQQTDFFISEDNHIGFTSFKTLKQELVPVKKSQYPFKLPKGIHVLRKKRFDLRNNLWLQVKGFYRHHSREDEVYCFGDVLRIPNGVNSKHQLTGLQKLQRINTNQCILVSNLGFTNDYLHITVEANGRKNVESYWLLKWVL